jgi:hypothetical protein
VNQSEVFRNSRGSNFVNYKSRSKNYVDDVGMMISAEAAEEVFEVDCVMV